MIRTRTLAVLAAVALSLSACTEDDPAPAAPAAAPAHDPVVWASEGESCAELTGPIVVWEELEVTRPLTLESFTPVGLEGDLSVRAASVVQVPPATAVPGTGSIRGAEIPARWADEVGWSDRVPLAGAEVGPGRYFVFLEAAVRGPASYDGIDLSWTDESGEDGRSTWQVQDRYQPDCGD